MVEILNGSRGAPMAGWVIARVGGATLIGMPKRLKVMEGGGIAPITGLKPVYEFIVTAARDHGGNIVGSRWDAAPVMFLHCVDEIEFERTPDYVLECGRFTHQMQVNLRSIVENAEAVKQHLRRAELGIVVAPSMPSGGAPRLG